MIKQSLFILGRQPKLSSVELESLYGDVSRRLIGNFGMLVNVTPGEVNFDRLGGSTRLCEVMDTLDSKTWPAVEKYVKENVDRLLGDMPHSKLNIGISVYGLAIDPKQIMSAGLSIKREAKQQLGRSIRFIPNKDTALNSAQVIHNGLLDEKGLELIVLADGEHTLIAKTLRVQNIADYSNRDYGRPKRDPRVGMLPPKLAQIMVNIGLGSTPKSAENTDLTILDPFCGTGVVLQEALLMGYSAYGSDVDERMIDYSNKNINDWLSRQTKIRLKLPAVIEIGDATNHQWKQPFNLVVSEVYLGRPLVSLPPEDKLIDIQRTCNIIIEKFLINLHKQIPKGLVVCLAVPAWRKLNGSFLRLPLIDRIEDLGYNSVSFECANGSPLIYSREIQVVAREILVLRKR